MDARSIFGLGFGFALGRRRIAGALAASLVGVLASVCPADDVDDIAAAIARDASSRAEAAAKILEVVKSLGDSPADQVRLCEKTYEHGMVTPAGYGSAAAALDLLAKLAPTRMAEWNAKRLETCRLQYYRGAAGDKAANGYRYLTLLLSGAKAAGDKDNWKDAAALYRQAYNVARTLKLPQKKAIYDDLRAASSLEMVHNRVRVLKAALAKNPDDTTSRKRLVMACLVDLDQPHEAARYLGPTLDATLVKNVKLAASEAADLADADFHTLGVWYRDLAARTPLKHTKARMLTRALENLNLYLDVYTTQDTQRLRATTLVSLIEAELKKLGAGAVTLPAGIIMAMSFEADQCVKGDEGTVTVKNAVARAGGADLTGVVRRGTTGVAGKFGKGVTLAAGSRGYIQIPLKATAGLKAFTFAFWVKTRESGAGSTYWDHPTLLGYGTNGDGSRDFGITTNRGLVGFWSGLAPVKDSKYASETLRVGDGAWHHVALTNDGKSMMLYVDARAVTTRGLPTGQSLTKLAVLLGASHSDGWGSPSRHHHGGTYDEFQLYNRALTAGEIAGISRLALASVKVSPSAKPKPPTKPDPKPRPPAPDVPMWAAAAAGNVEVIKQHIAAGTDVNRHYFQEGMPGSGATALHVAIVAGHTKAATLLIQAGANVNIRARDKHGGTPLHWAAAFGKVEQAALLIRAGADVNARDNNGGTPLTATRFQPHLAREGKAAIARILRQAGGK